MVKKYYAVKEGKTPGIYMSWDDCKKQVTGYSGAVYKSFTDITQADAFMKMGASETVIIGNYLELPNDEAVAYVDGSFLEASGEYAYGVVMFHAGAEKHFNGKSNDTSMVSMRNVAGEITGSMEAMKYAVENKCKKLTIYHDYEGISKWCQGLWKTNKEGTISYKKYYDSVKKLVEIHFVKVKGHSGDKYNEVADKLAKKALGINT